jgi:hypothetical protein
MKSIKALTQKHKELKAARKVLHQETPPIQVKAKSGHLMKIGELAKQTGETVPTLRFWLKEGLIACAQRTESGYQLFDKTMITRAKQIRKMQERRRTIAEIGEQVGKDEVSDRFLS